MCAASPHIIRFAFRRCSCGMRDGDPVDERGVEGNFRCAITFRDFPPEIKTRCKVVPSRSSTSQIC